jgi:aryl-alcohol dehydrogenase-like predicted oxidoreductase
VERQAIAHGRLYRLVDALDAAAKEAEKEIPQVALNWFL